jgi:hypothetical protein
MDDSDVPQRVLDMVRMFLASSTRGEHTVLNLETRNQQLFTKYRSVESLAGTSAKASTPDTNTTRTRRNPARARRSRLRLENFQRKKEDEKLQETGMKTAAGEPSNTASKLVVQISNEKKETVEIGPHSPILQVDGQDADKFKEVSFTFKSEYGEEDIRFSLGEIFPPFVAQLDSRVRLGRLAADHQCIVSLRARSGQREGLSWPKLPLDDDVFREVKKIK